MCPPSDGTSRDAFDRRGARRLRAVVVATLLAAIAFASAAPAQEQEQSLSVRSPDEAVLAYMERLGLKRLMAAELSDRLKSSQGAERVAVAERLGKLYVELIGAAETPEQRRTIEDRSRELLKLVPEADTFDLRLSLAKALYLQAEESVERHRLRLATTEDVTDAERLLRLLKPQMDEIATKVHRRVEVYEKQEEDGDTSERLAADLADNRRVRSQAFYYAGWCDYYLAYLTGQDEFANDALKAFGWLLNSRGGKPASVDRLPTGLLKYEHVARAAIGCALACSAKGNDTAAMHWLEVVEQEPELTDAVREQILPRRIVVAAAAKRWADIERLVRTARKSDRRGGGPNVEPLSPGAARLLAVVTLEADKVASREVIEPLSAIALGDLVARSEVGQVLDLVNRYGTAPIGDTGFIVNYVRGLQQYEKARSAHTGKPLPQAQADIAKPARPGAKPAAPGATAPPQPVAAAPENPDEPSRVHEVINLYRQAATMLEAAVGQDDAESFKAERAKASMLVGMSLYYAGEAEKAAERFTLTSKIAGTPKQSEEAMWLAVVALDYAVEHGGGESADKALVKRREEAATMYLQSHRDSDRAAKLLLRRAMTGVLEAEESVRILMGVPKDSPLYPAARQHAARLLYLQYRNARGGEREFAAMRFVGVAEEVLAMDRRAAVEGSGEEAAKAADRVVVRTRQILDALLSGASPDVERAERAMDVLEGVKTVNRLDLSAHQTELTFRRFQIALARDDGPGAATLLEKLRAEGGQFAAAGDQLMYRRAVALRQKQPAEPAHARDVVTYGLRIIDRMTGRPAGSTGGPEADAGAMKDPVIMALHDTVAQTAFELWESEGAQAMRDVAIRLDTALLRASPGTERPLRRLARTSEAVGDGATALECWRTLLAGTKPPADAWFEARYNSLRLLAATDATRAREVLRQHLTLYPNYGPEPWGAKFKELDSMLGPEPVAAPLPSTSPAGGGGDDGGGGKGGR